jgi:hypothetical protein
MRGAGERGRGRHGARERGVSGADREGTKSAVVVGVYLADRENTAPDIAREMGRSQHWSVEQRWIALGKGRVPEALAPLTMGKAEPPQPKFSLLNGLLGQVDLERYEFVLVCDDDIVLPDGFLDRYLDVVTRYDLALAQPARTHDSYIDHWLVEQLDGLDARRTRFVEIGPLVSIRRDAARHLLPFSEESAMGWGYDFVWPVVMEEAGLRIGIVDATPVAHNLRKPVTHYDHESASRSMQAFLSRHPHLAPQEAFVILEAYS